jgi:hypothetical protein
MDLEVWSSIMLNRASNEALFLSFAFLNMSSAADFDFNAIPSVAVVCPDILQNRPALWEMAPALPAPIPD